MLESFNISKRPCEFDGHLAARLHNCCTALEQAPKTGNGGSFAKFVGREMEPEPEHRVFPGGAGKSVMFEITYDGISGMPVARLTGAG